MTGRRMRRAALAVALFLLVVSGEAGEAASGTAWVDCSRVDIMIIVAHPDDDQLYMGAVVPTYVEQGRSVITVFITKGNSRGREAEALNGAWEAGERVKPVFGPFRDKRTMSLADARKVWPEKEVLAFLVKQIARYRPTILVTHDVNGEYGHGAHRLTSLLVQKAYRACPSWQPAKLYIHLYGGNPIKIDTNKPLRHYGGKTALQVAKAAFKCHKSQQKSRFYVSNNNKYSIEKFGLFCSEVGYENVHNSMFDGLGYAVYRINWKYWAPIIGRDTDMLARIWGRKYDFMQDGHSAGTG